MNRRYFFASLLMAKGGLAEASSGIAAPSYLQQTSQDCGVAALRFLLKTNFNVQLPHKVEAQLEEASLSMPLSLLQLKVAAQLSGLRADGWRARRIEVTKMLMPSIAAIEGVDGEPGHFLAMLGSHGADIRYFDPAIGVLRRPWKSFMHDYAQSDFSFLNIRRSDTH